MRVAEDESLHGLVGVDTAQLLHSEKMLVLNGAYTAFNDRSRLNRKQKLNNLIFFINQISKNFNYKQYLKNTVMPMSKVCNL